MNRPECHCFLYLRAITKLIPMKKLGALLLLPLGSVARADPVGEVDTVFKFIGPDHKIVVDAHDDTKVGGVTCYVSRAAMPPPCATQ